MYIMFLVFVPINYLAKQFIHNQQKYSLNTITNIFKKPNIKF